MMRTFADVPYFLPFPAPSFSYHILLTSLSPFPEVLIDTNQVGKTCTITLCHGSLIRGGTYDWHSWLLIATLVCAASWSWAGVL